MEGDKIKIELTKLELEVLIAAVGAASPISKELEVVQFRIYHKLISRIDEFNESKK